MESPLTVKINVEGEYISNASSKDNLLSMESSATDAKPALTTEENSIAPNKSFEMEKLPETQNLLGLCYFNLKDFTQAKTIFINMLEKSPLNINTLLNVAKCCKELKETDRALEYLDKIVDTFPECEEAQELIREIS